jgi:hypothetical protein
MFGAAVRNDEGGALISDFSTTYTYIGEMTLVSAVNNNKLGSAVSYFPRAATLTTYTVDNPASVTRTYQIASAAFPMVFIESPTAFALLRVYQVSGGVYRADVLLRTQSPGTVRVHAFAPFVPTTGGGYGMRLYDADGNLKFDSTTKPLIITGRSTITAPSFANNGGTDPSFRAFDDASDGSETLESRWTRKRVNVTGSNSFATGASVPRPAVFFSPNTIGSSAGSGTSFTGGAFNYYVYHYDANGFYTGYRGSIDYNYFITDWAVFRLGVLAGASSLTVSWIAEYFSRRVTESFFLNGYAPGSFVYTQRNEVTPPYASSVPANPASFTALVTDMSLYD